MRKKSIKKRSLTVSVIVLCLSIAALIGGTFAWFTDTASTSVNTIQAGTLDVDLLMKSGEEWVSAEGKTLAWQTQDGRDASNVYWEPGCTYNLNTFKIANTGSLWVKAKFRITHYDGDTSLLDAIEFSLSGLTASTDKIILLDANGEPLADQSTAITYENYDEYQFAIAPNTESGEITFTGHMKEEAGNEYQGKSLEGISITLYASQYTAEYDSFDNQYDKDAPDFIPATWSGESAEADYDANSQEAQEYSVVVDEETKATVSIPANAGVTFADGTEMTEDNDTLKLVITPGSEQDIVVDAGDSMTTYDVSLVSVETNKVVKTSAVPMTVTLSIGFVELQKFYHKGVEYENKVENDTDVDEVGEFHYNETTGIVTFMTNTFSPFTAVYNYSGGLGTEAHPYLVKGADQWVAMCEMWPYDQTKYPGQYYIYPKYSNEGYCYVNLVGDVDLEGAELPYYCGVYALYLDGNGYTVKNASDCATLFDNDGNYFYNENIFENLNVKDCDVDCSLFGYGTKNASGNSVAFENVTVDGCSAQGGAFLYYCGSGTAKFKNCTVTKTNISGGSSMAVGGYVGNISTGNITVDTCKFGGSVVSTGEACGGFVGQSANTNGTNVVIKNSEILAGTVIRNVGGGLVAAFDAHNASVNYAEQSNTFNGKLETNGTVYKQGTNATTNVYTPICTAADFTINADGTITYNGTATLDKVSVTSYVRDDYIYYEHYYGGYSWNIESVKQTNITTGTTIKGLTKITGLKNVVSSAETPVGLQTLDTTHVGEIYEGTYYFSARTNSWGHYMLSGTYDSSTGSAVDPTSLNVYIKITVYDETEALSGVVSGATLSYSVPTSVN